MTQPINDNALSPLGFSFVLKRAPILTYNCQAATLPSFSMNPTIHETPKIILKKPGDKLTFDPLSLRFQVDEDMKNYQEIFNWMKGLTGVLNTEEYRKFFNFEKNTLGPIKDVYSDGTLIIETSAHNPNIQIFFINMFPTNLSPLEFDTTQEGTVNYLQSDVTFEYEYFTVETIR